LRRTIHPPKLTYLFHQTPRRFRREFSEGSHVEALLGLAPTGRPKYLKGNSPILQLRKVLANRMKLWETLTSIKLLFQKFTFKPEHNSKPRKTAFKVHKFWIEASLIHKVSPHIVNVKLPDHFSQFETLYTDAYPPPFSTSHLTL
jgi:hypothetical protein